MLVQKVWYLTPDGLSGCGNVHYLCMSLLIVGLCQSTEACGSWVVRQRGRGAGSEGAWCLYRESRSRVTVFYRDENL